MRYSDCLVLKARILYVGSQFALPLPANSFSTRNGSGEELNRLAELSHVGITSHPGVVGGEQDCTGGSVSRFALV